MPKLRTSWGTSFKAPKLVNVYDLTNNRAGHPHVTARSLPAAWAPSRWCSSKRATTRICGRRRRRRGRRVSTSRRRCRPVVSLTYYAIDYENRILVPGPTSPVEILLQEDQWSSVIQRQPSQAAIDSTCTETALLFNTTLGQCQTAPVAAIVDLRVRNMAARACAASI